MYHGVESALAESFRRTLKYSAKHFEIVPLEEIVAQALGLRRKRVGLVALTFDDGLRNNYTVAYPILRELRLPATFFVCPGLIGGTRTIWTYDVQSFMKRVKPEDRKQFYRMAGVEEGEGIDSIISWMKSLPVVQREEVEGQIRTLTPDFHFTEEEHEKFDLMNWDELKALDPSIVSIGSHSLSHADLPHVDAERLEAELAISQAELQARLERPICDFAYPNGSYNDAVVSIVRRFYRSAVTVNHGGIGPGNDVFTLERIGADFDLPRFSWWLAIHAGQGHRCQAL